MKHLLLRCCALALALIALPATASTKAPLFQDSAGRTQEGIATEIVIQGTATDRGLSVTTGGTAQQMMAANTARRGYAIQNQSSGACYINGSTTATQDYHSLLIAAGAYYETPPTHVGTGAVSIVCAVSSASVYAREW